MNFMDIATETRRDPIFGKVSETISSGAFKSLKDEEFNTFKLRELELSVEL